MEPKDEERHKRPEKVFLAHAHFCTLQKLKGELMVLGFLAFTVRILNTAKAFNQDHRGRAVVMRRAH